MKRKYRNTQKKAACTAAPRKDKTLLPLGALMLAASVSGWAQDIVPELAQAPLPPQASTPAPTEGKTMSTVTVQGKRDRNEQTTRAAW